MLEPLETMMLMQIEITVCQTLQTLWNIQIRLLEKK